MKPSFKEICAIWHHCIHVHINVLIHAGKSMRSAQEGCTSSIYKVGLIEMAMGAGSDHCFILYLSTIIHVTTSMCYF